MTRKELLDSILKDRIFLMMSLLVLALMLVLIVNTIIRLQVSDVQVPVRYSGFGQSNIFRGQWYTSAEFIGFALVVGILNSYIAVKLFTIWRAMALALTATNIALIVFALLAVNAIFNLSPNL